MTPCHTTLSLVFWLMLAFSSQAHRTQGLLQATLVEVLPSQIGVEITLNPGIDIASQVLAQIDINQDGVISTAESTLWSTHFMAHQTVTLDGVSLTPELIRVRISPLSEFNAGHAEIIVQYAAELPVETKIKAAHILTVQNIYEPIPSTYQSNGLVPKSPQIRVTRHHRDEREQKLTLEYSSAVPAQAVPTSK